MRSFVPALVMLAMTGVSVPSASQAPAANTTDLDAFMARALQRRDVNRKTLSDYVLDEVELFEILGPGRTPLNRFKREYTWYVRDGVHVRSPLKFDGVPIPEADRRAYEDRWYQSELNRRKFRTERDERRAKEGKPPSLGPAINEPRFVSDSGSTPAITTWRDARRSTATRSCASSTTRRTCFLTRKSRESRSNRRRRSRRHPRQSGARRRKSAVR